MTRSRTTLPLLGAVALLLLGGCAADEKKCPPRDGACPAGQFCDESDGLCKPVGGDCVARDSICGDAQTCDIATRTCLDNPAPPALGPLIDRMGRPAINTALTNPFDVAVNPATMAPEPDGNATKNRYNQDEDVAGWTAPTKWTGYIRQNLAILDGLDRVCGNQLAADAMGARYGLLATVLAGDALHLDTTRATCREYLAVELSALAGLGGGKPLEDCGGRALGMDVIDVSYSLLATGSSYGVTDGIESNSDFLSTFPFLSAPPAN